MLHVRLPPRPASSLLVLPDSSAPDPSTLSLHDALPIFSHRRQQAQDHPGQGGVDARRQQPCPDQDRKSTRLNSSHVAISYAVFCLKKKKENQTAFSTLNLMHIDWSIESR